MEIKIEEFTSPILITVEASASLDEIMVLMQEHKIRHLPVTDNKRIVGIVSERDLLTHIGKSWGHMVTAQDIMSSDILSVYLNEGLGEVAFKLSTHKIGSALVLNEKDEVYGIFTTTDALNALVEAFYEEARGKSDLKGLQAFDKS
jgi:acetoin utilization protein AcuB